MCSEEDGSFNVEIELGNGEKKRIKLTEEEYNKIFEENDRELLLKKIKEA